MYRVVLSRQAVKDKEKIIQAGYGKRVKALLELIAEDPYTTPPPYEKLIGDLKGFYSRRINLQHRLVYEVREVEKVVVIARMWTHYE
jgi:Txe/YoeB family toxin of toxin-antitoxin system